MKIYTGNHQCNLFIHQVTYSVITIITIPFYSKMALVKVTMSIYDNKTILSVSLLRYFWYYKSLLSSKRERTVKCLTEVLIGTERNSKNAQLWWSSHLYFQKMKIGCQRFRQASLQKLLLYDLMYIQNTDECPYWMLKY